MIGDAPPTGRDPAHLFCQLPGISAKLAHRILEQLDVRSLEELELAAHDGRLNEVKGFGQQRIQAIKKALAGRLGGFASSSQQNKRKGE